MDSPQDSLQDVEALVVVVQEWWVVLVVVDAQE